MNLTYDEAEFLRNLQKMMHDQTLRVPARGERERYPASDLERLRDFTFLMQVARSRMKLGRTHPIFSSTKTSRSCDWIQMVRDFTQMLMAQPSLHIHHTFTYMTKTKRIITPICFRPISPIPLIFSRRCTTF